MSNAFLFAVAFAFGFFSGAALVIVMTYTGPQCNHQWHTILNSWSNGKNLWIDECKVCGQRRVRSET